MNKIMSWHEKIRLIVTENDLDNSNTPTFNTPLYPYKKRHPMFYLDEYNDSMLTYKMVIGFEYANDESGRIFYLARRSYLKGFNWIDINKDKITETILSDFKEYKINPIHIKRHVEKILSHKDESKRKKNIQLFEEFLRKKEVVHARKILNEIKDIYLYEEEKWK